MIQTETIIINSMLVPVYILTYYDGIKEGVDLENHAIFLWYDERENLELWLRVKPHSPNTLLAYLSNKIGIMDLINSSDVIPYRRSFDNYKEFCRYKDLDNLEEIEFPENVRLGQDFISILNAARTIRTTFTSQDDLVLSINDVDFRQIYNPNLVQTKVTSSNNTHFNDFDNFETMAA